MVTLAYTSLLSTFKGFTPKLQFNLRFSEICRVELVVVNVSPTVAGRAYHETRAQPESTRSSTENCILCPWSS